MCAVHGNTYAVIKEVLREMDGSAFVPPAKLVEAAAMIREALEKYC